MSTSTLAPADFTIKGENIVPKIVLNLSGDFGHGFNGTKPLEGDYEVIDVAGPDGLTDILDLYVRNDDGDRFHVAAWPGKDYTIAG